MARVPDKVPVKEVHENKDGWSSWQEEPHVGNGVYQVRTYCCGETLGIPCLFAHDVQLRVNQETGKPEWRISENARATAAMRREWFKRRKKK